MRELVVVDRSIVIENGKTVLHEKKYHGLLHDNGSFQLLGYYGKKFPEARLVHMKTVLCLAEKKRAA